MNDKMKNLLVRGLSGIGLIVLVPGAIWWERWSAIAVLVLMIIGGMWELFKMARKQGYAPQTFLGLTIGVLPLACQLCGIGTLQTHLFLLTAIVVFMIGLPLMFVCELYRKSATPLANIGTTILGVIYVAMPLTLIYCIREVDPILPIIFIAMVWANDVFAYLVGMTIGRHRLFERISPKKSWEGFFGGLLGSVGVAWLVASNSDKGLLFWGGLAILVTVTAVLGDLVESMFKRSVDVKDSGAIIPGHGGVLDRFDALLISAPFVCLFLMYFYQL